MSRKSGGKTAALRNETVHGLSRFAVSPKRLGAVSSAACVRLAILPRARQCAARRDSRVVSARLARARKHARFGHAASELTCLECGGLAAAFTADDRFRKRSR